MHTPHGAIITTPHASHIQHAPGQILDIDVLGESRAVTCPNTPEVTGCPRAFHFDVHDA